MYPIVSARHGALEAAFPATLVKCLIQKYTSTPNNLIGIPEPSERKCSDSGWYSEPRTMITESVTHEAVR